MRIAYFPNQIAQNGAPVLSAFLDGCSAMGIDTVKDSFDADAAVIWSVLWHGRMSKNKQVYEHYRQQNKPVIIIDIGTLNRGTTWKIAVNNITSKGYYGHLDQLDWDRPKKLNIVLHTQINANPNVVIALQHERSLQLEGINIEDWLQQTVAILKNNTDRPIIVRPHPRCQLTCRLPANVSIEVPRKLANTYDSFDIQYNCHAMINYNSGPGIQAAIAGTRPIVDLSSLAYPVSIGFADIEQPYTKDRNTWLTQICHTEYTQDEIKQGQWLKRLAPMLNT